MDFSGKDNRVQEYLDLFEKVMLRIVVDALTFDAEVKAASKMIL